MPDPSTGIAVGASLLGASTQSNATSNAADSQAAATREGIASNERIDALNRADRQPWIDTGIKYLAQYGEELNKQYNPADALSDPGYKFARDQGQQALDRKFSAGGGRQSGAVWKAASQYNSDYASTRAGDVYKRGQDRLNRLAALAQVGQTAPTNANAGNAAIYQSQGNAAGAAQLAQGNIWGSSFNQIGAAASRWAQPKSNSNNYLAPGSTTGPQNNNPYD